MLVGQLTVRSPFPWRHLLEYFAHRLIPQFERIENDCYVRQVGARTIAVAYDAASSQLQITSSGRVKAAQVLDNVARLLDIGHDAQQIQKHLRRSPVLKRRIAIVPGMRPLGACRRSSCACARSSASRSPWLQRARSCAAWWSAAER